MMGFHEDQDITETTRYKVKYWLRVIAATIVVCLPLIIICGALEINVFYGMFISVPAITAFQNNYTRIMNWLKSGNIYFWLIMFACMVIAVLFICEVFVRFYLHIR